MYLEEQKGHDLKVALLQPTLGKRSRGCLATTGYHKIPIISPGLIFVQKAFLMGLFFGGAYTLYFQRGLLSEGILHFKIGLASQ